MAHHCLHFQSLIEAAEIKPLDQRFDFGFSSLPDIGQVAQTSRRQYLQHHHTTLPCNNFKAVLD